MHKWLCSSVFHSQKAAMVVKSLEDAVPFQFRVTGRPERDPWDPWDPWPLSSKYFMRVDLKPCSPLPPDPQRQRKGLMSDLRACPNFRDPCFRDLKLQKMRYDHCDHTSIYIYMLSYIYMIYIYI